MTYIYLIYFINKLFDKSFIQPDENAASKIKEKWACNSRPRRMNGTDTFNNRYTTLWSYEILLDVVLFSVRTLVLNLWMVFLLFQASVGLWNMEEKSD